MYFAWSLGLTNHILRNVIGNVFHHITQGGEGKNIQLKLIELNQRIKIN